MSVRIFKDVEEALEREVRRITFHDMRTLDNVVLQDTFDPFTGELVQKPIEPNFHDSSADTGHIQYPHIFIKLLKSKEDRTSGRVVPQYGKWCRTPIYTSPKAFEVVTYGSDGLVTTVGNTFTTGIYKISKVQPGLLLRLLAGNNKGTYIIDSVIKDAQGQHSVVVLEDLLVSLPTFRFNDQSRDVVFDKGVDLSTIKIGDKFEDFSNNTYNITNIDSNNNTITIDDTSTPDSSTGSRIYRTGNIFKDTDLSFVRFLILDPSKPVERKGISGSEESTSTLKGTSPQIPIDAYYLIRVDSKTRENHIRVLNRIWEEFNPPRTALPVIERSALSAEQQLTEDIPTGGSNLITVESNSDFNINDDIFIFNDLMPSKNAETEGFERPFSSKVVSLIGTTQIELEDIVPDTFTTESCTRIVSNSTLRLFMFHFVDHVTKDLEGAQYWVHEFTFWVQLWIDKLEQSKEFTTITSINTDVTIIDTEVEIE